MEKTGTTKTVIKEEKQQQRHCASKSADANAIVDPEALDCLRCLHTLVPLVYQCASGHVVCSSCHTKCTSCFSKMVERTWQYMSLACPNAIHGYHQKTCSKTAGSVSIASRVVKMGPCGGGGGNAWEMEVHGVNRIMKIILWHGIMVDAMMVLYDHDGRLAPTMELRGCPQAVNCSEIYFEQDEYLTGVKGHGGECEGWFRLRSLTFITNQRTLGPYGTEEGAPFELPAVGGRIIGFHGRSGTFLDALGIYVKMDP